MTIAAGLIYSDGILLGTDTEVTGGAFKGHQLKMREFRHGRDSAHIAFAGHAKFATTALDKLERAFAKPAYAREPTLELIETVVESEYRRLVLTNPDRQTMPLEYSFLIVLKINKSKPQLYSTEGIAVQKATDSECIGIGEIFGKQMMRQRFSGRTPFAARFLMASLLSAAKEYVPDVGGMSLIRDIRNDGTFINYYEDQYLKKIADYDRVFRWLAWELELQALDPTMLEEHWKGNLQNFINKLTERRAELMSDKEHHQQYVEASEMMIKHQAALSVHRRTKRGQ